MAKKILFVSDDPDIALIMMVAFEKTVDANPFPFTDGVEAECACMKKVDYDQHIKGNSRRNAYVRDVKTEFGVSIEKCFAKLIGSLDLASFDWICCPENLVAKIRQVANCPANDCFLPRSFSASFGVSRATAKTIIEEIKKKEFSYTVGVK